MPKKSKKIRISTKKNGEYAKGLINAMAYKKALSEAYVAKLRELTEGKKEDNND